MVELRYEDDTGQEASVRLSEECSTIRVGRGKQCELQTNNATVSTQHCEIELTDTGLRLTDLQSSNGTFHGRKRVRSTDLSDGDVFFCGNFPVTVVWTSEAEHTASRPVEVVESTRVALGPSMPAFNDVVDPTPLPGDARADSPAPSPEPVESTRVNTGWVEDESGASEMITSPGHGSSDVPVERDESTSLDVGVASMLALEGFDPLNEPITSPEREAVEPTTAPEIPARPETTVLHNIGDFESAQRSLDIGVLLDEATGQIDALEAELAEARSQLSGRGGSEPDTSAETNELADVREELAQVRRERDFNETELKAARTVRETQASRLARAEDAKALLEAQAIERDAEAQALEERLTEAQDARDRSLADLDAASERVAELETQRNTAVDSAADAERALETAEQQSTDLSKELGHSRKQLEEAQSTAQDAEAQRMAITEERDQLRDRLEEAHGASRDAEAQRDALGDERDQLQQQLQDADAARARADEQVASLQASHAALEDDKAKALDTSEAAETRAAEALTEKEDTEAKLTEAQERAADALREKEGTEAKLTEAQERVGALTEELRELSGRHKDVDESLESERTASASLRAERDGLKADLEAASKEQMRAQVAAEEAEQAMEAANTRAGAAEGDLDLGQKSWQAIEKELRAELQSLNEALSAAVQPATFADLERQAQASEEARVEAVAKLARLEDEASASQTRANSSTDRASELAASLAEITDAHEAATREVQELKQLLLGTASAAEVEDFRKQIETLESEHHRAEAERDRHQAEATAAAGKLSELEADISEAAQGTIDLTSERDLLLAQVSGLEDELQTARTEASAALARASGGDEAAAELEKVAAEHRSAAEERDSLRGSLEVLEAQKDALEAEVANRDRRLTASEDELAGLRTEMEELRAQPAPADTDDSEVARLSDELETLRSTLGRTEAELQDERATLSSLREEQSREAQALKEAVESREGLAARVVSLEADLTALQQSSDASMSSGRDNLQTFRTAIRAAFEEINGKASELKTGVGLVGEYFEDIQEGFADPAARDSTYETLRETLEGMLTSSSDVKERLKAVRKLLGD